jgi:endoglucanase
VLSDTAFHPLFITPGDMIHLQDSANTLYMTGTAFLFIIYSDTAAHGRTRP